MRATENIWKKMFSMAVTLLEIFVWNFPLHIRVDGFNVTWLNNNSEPFEITVHCHQISHKVDNYEPSDLRNNYGSLLDGYISNCFHSQHQTHLMDTTAIVEFDNFFPAQSYISPFPFLFFSTRVIMELLLICNGRKGCLSKRIIQSFRCFNKNIATLPRWVHILFF